MTSGTKAKQNTTGTGPASTEMDAAAVAAYLQDHPQMFEQYPEALARLNLRHETGGAVSLIERQVQVLRRQYEESQHRLKELLHTARENESRVTHLNALAQSLIGADSLGAVARRVRASLIESFDVQDVFLGLLCPRPENADSRGVAFLAPQDPLRNAFQDFFRTGKAECGSLTPEKTALLFPGREESLHSVALIPLDRVSDLGLLVLADADPARFTPEMGTWFLELTANLVASACRAHMPAQAA